MKVLIALFKLTRVSNLIMLAIAQFIFYYLVFPKTTVIIETDNLSFIILTLSTIFIAAGGYIINDYYDIDCDKINKPHKTFIPVLVSKKSALYFYYSVTILGILLAYLFCYLIHKPKLIFLFIGICVSLFTYSKYLKKIVLLGNILISLLVALNSFIIIYLIPTPLQFSYGIELLMKFSFFAFYVNLIREIIKDIEDINGDHNAKMKTTPIILGINRTKKLIYFISIVPIYFMIRFWIDDLKTNIDAQIFFLIFILASLLIFFVKLNNAKSKNDFSILSMLLKGILVFGLILIFFIIY